MCEYTNTFGGQGHSLGKGKKRKETLICIMYDNGNGDAWLLFMIVSSEDEGEEEEEDV